MAKKNSELYSEKVTFSMPIYVSQALEAYAEKTLLPKSRIVQIALNEYLKIDKPTSQPSQVQAN